MRGVEKNITTGEKRVGRSGDGNIEERGREKPIHEMSNFNHKRCCISLRMLIVSIYFVPMLINISAN